jgi:hypothetical protein
MSINTQEHFKIDYAFIAEMIDKMNDARCNWTLHDRYDFERKLKPEER